MVTFVTAVGAVLFGAGLIFWVLCALEAITTPPERVRNLPKPAWVLITILLSWVGGILWVVAGRPRRTPGSRPARGTIPPEYDRPGRAASSNPDDDAAFLAQLKARAERQRAQAEEDAKRRGEGEATPT